MCQPQIHKPLNLPVKGDGGPRGGGVGAVFPPQTDVASGAVARQVCRSAKVAQHAGGASFEIVVLPGGRRDGGCGNGSLGRVGGGCVGKGFVCGLVGKSLVAIVLSVFRGRDSGGLEKWGKGSVYKEVGKGCVAVALPALGGRASGVSKVGKTRYGFLGRDGGLCVAALPSGASSVGHKHRNKASRVALCVRER